MVMLTVYVDESENTPERNQPDKLRIYTIACNIGFDKQWVKFQKKWKAVLNKDVLPKWREVYGERKPVFFHMTDFANVHSKIYGDWSEKKKADFLARLHGIMAKHTLRRIVTNVFIKDYGELADEEKLALGHPHAAATINCLKQIREWANSQNLREPMRYVFEKGSVHDEKIRKLFDVMLDDEMKKAYRVGGLEFKDKRDFSPLQASDILAVESRWEVCRQFDPAITRNQRQSLKSLLKPKIDDWYFLNQEHMRAILNNPHVRKFMENTDLSEHVVTAKKRKWI